MLLRPPRLLPLLLLLPLLPLLVPLLCTIAAAQQQPPQPRGTLTYRGFQRLPEQRFPGLSGIAYASGDAYWGVLEWEAKLVRFQIRTKADASIESVSMAREIRLAEGKDFEGVALVRPDVAVVSTETPEILEVSLKNGRRLRSFPLPHLFDQVVHHQGCESLACSADGKSLWTANERALKVDGNPQTPATPMFSATRVRLQRYDLTDDAAGAGATPREQYEYETSGVHGAAGQIGLCDLAALPDGRLLALERSAAKSLSGDKSIRTRIYLADPTGATDISKPPYDSGLVNQSPAKVAKTLLFDGFVCDADGENLEGLCLGPELAPGRWAVIGVVDNTDGGMGVSAPAVVTFELDLNAPPATQPSSGPASNASGAK